MSTALAEIEGLDARLSRVERDVSRIDASMDELRATLADERVATGRLAESVGAHARRSDERHAEVLAALKRLDAAGAAREQRLAKVALAVIGVLGSAVAGLVAQP